MLIASSSLFTIANMGASLAFDNFVQRMAERIQLEEKSLHIALLKLQNTPTQMPFLGSI